MKFMSNVAVTVACLGLLLPQSVLAQQTTAAKKSAKPPVRDLVLGQGGTVRGQVVDAQNNPVASTLVAVVANGKKIRETTTDGNGRFSVSGLGSGVYAVGSAGGFGLYRTWSATAAPPATPTAALIVEDGSIERGQSQVLYWLTDPWVISLAIAAAIAIPIAVNNNKKSGS